MTDQRDEGLARREQAVIDRHSQLFDRCGTLGPLVATEAQRWVLERMPTRETIAHQIASAYVGQPQMGIDEKSPRSRWLFAAADAIRALLTERLTSPRKTNP